MKIQNSTLDYYDQQASAYVKRTEAELSRDALHEFLRHVPAGGKILDAGCGGGRDLAFFASQKFSSPSLIRHPQPAQKYEIEGFDGSSEMVKLAQGRLATTDVRVWRADFMMLSLPKETYDGIWAHQVLNHFSAEACQRIMATFFMALKSKGVLFVSFDEGSGTQEDRIEDPLGVTPGVVRTLYKYPYNDVASLVRQHGFQILAAGENPEVAQQWAFIARRL